MVCIIMVGKPSLTALRLFINCSGAVPLPCTSVMPLTMIRGTLFDVQTCAIAPPSISHKLQPISFIVLMSHSLLVNLSALASMLLLKCSVPSRKFSKNAVSYSWIYPSGTPSSSRKSKSNWQHFSIAIDWNIKQIYMNEKRPGILPIPGRTYFLWRM